MMHDAMGPGSFRRVFVVFSGHNFRAVIALCRFFSQAQAPFVIAASGVSDPIFLTRYAERVVHVRSDSTVTVDLFARIAGACPAVPVYVPTTEFINWFVLSQRSSLEALGWVIGLPTADLYHRLTAKRESQEIFNGLAGLEVLPELKPEQWTPPFVVKPSQNLVGDVARYPLLCLDEEQAVEGRRLLAQGTWFAQRYVDGRSFYLCAYLDRDGRDVSFWQENLLQQPGGKSILLARFYEGPVLDAGPILRALAALGFVGPLMVEVMMDGSRPVYIECNPRFWGPLQLAVDACPELLVAFCEDAGFSVVRPTPRWGTRGHYYAWRSGDAFAGLRRFTEEAECRLEALAMEHDVFDRPDTRALVRTVA